MRGESIGVNLVTKKCLIELLAILFLTSIAHVHAQQMKIPRIGYLSASGRAGSPDPQLEAFTKGMLDLGYLDGKNIQIAVRYAEGNQSRIPDLINELVKLNVDVIVVSVLPAIRAAKQATQTIPIVMVSTADPVSTGLVDSFARPGGNLTGVSSLVRGLSGKRLELLRESVPNLSRVGVLWDMNGPAPAIGFKEYQTAARDLKVTIQSLAVKGPRPEFEEALLTAVKEQAGALVVIRNSALNQHYKQIMQLTLTHRLPTMTEGGDYVDAGGLMSYAAIQKETHRRAAVFVDKILKGANPAELPIEQPTKFELVINLKTAKQIGVIIPPNVLARADRVIK